MLLSNFKNNFSNEYMKKILSKAVLAVVGVFSVSSCSDFLDQTSASEQDADQVYTSVYYTGLAVNKLYGLLAQDRTYAQDLAITWNLNSDCELVDGISADDAHNSTRDRGNFNYNASPGWSNISGVWNALYGIIENCNLIISGVRNSSLMTEGGSTQTSMERSLGEALTMRALMYYDLVRYFGDVPMNMEPSASDLSNAYLQKTDRDVIMDAIIADLEEAVDYLPWAGAVSGYTTERITKGYAHGLLAQVALTRAGYAIRESAKDGYETAEYTDATYPTQRPAAADRKALYEKALTHLSAIINDGPHSLNPSFENEWTLINQLTLDETYRENIFEIPLGLGVSGELGYTVGVRLNAVTTEYGYTNSSGKLKVTAPLLYSYADGDSRRDITCAHFSIENENNVATEQMLGNAPFGIYCGKWDVRKMSDAWLAQNRAATAKNGYGINPVLLRYSQVLLYYAECMNELAGSPDALYTAQDVTTAGMTARQALKEVHVRAFDSANKSAAEAYIDGIASDKDTFFDAIVEENKLELAGEGFRKWDLIRWNLLVDKIIEFKQTYLASIEDGTYQEKVYYNYLNEAKTKIDMSSITWHGIPSGMTTSSYAGSKDSFGKLNADDETKNPRTANLPYISDGLVGSDLDNLGEGVEVKNRYLMPIATTTISAANGNLHNSYGYSD